MIQADLEKAVAEYIARSYIMDAVASGDVQERGATLAWAAPYASEPPLCIRAGETMEDTTLPAVVVVGREGQEDDLGNQALDIEVAIIWPAHGDGITADQLARLDAETDRIASYIFEDEIGELMHATNILNTAASVIGLASRSSRREFSEGVAMQTLTLNLYACDLAGIY